MPFSSAEAESQAILALGQAEPSRKPNQIEAASGGGAEPGRSRRARMPPGRRGAANAPKGEDRPGALKGWALAQRRGPFPDPAHRHICPRTRAAPPGGILALGRPGAWPESPHMTPQIVQAEMPPPGRNQANVPQSLRRKNVRDRTANANLAGSSLIVACDSRHLRLAALGAAIASC